MVAREGSAPSISGCRPDVILFHHRAEIGCGGWNRTSIRAFKGRCPTIRRPGNEMVEPEVVATSPYRIKSPVPVCCGFDSVKLTRDKLTRNTKMAKHDCVSDPKCLSAHFMFERFERELLSKEKRLLVQKLSG